MAETVEAEAARLGRLTTRLIRTARLEQEEIRPWMELTHFTSVVADAVNQYSRLSGDRRINVLERCDSTDVLADPDLLRLAISQLLDNACKYSVNGSSVDLIIAKQDGYISLRVLSTGTPILSSERSHIFQSLLSRGGCGPDNGRNRIRSVRCAQNRDCSWREPRTG